MPKMLTNIDELYLLLNIEEVKRNSISLIELYCKDHRLMCRHPVMIRYLDILTAF